MRFSVHLCQRKFLNKHLRFFIHVSHASFIPPLVAKSYAPCICHARTFPVLLKLPYPLYSGEEQEIQGKPRQATEQIDQIDLNANLLTVDDITLARLLVKFKKPLHITDGEVVIPTKVVKD